MIRILILVCVFCIPSIGRADTECNLIVKHPSIELNKDRLILNLLKLSISKVNDQVCYEEFFQLTTEARTSKLIEQKFIDIQWRSANSITDNMLKPISIPIFKGLLGYRIFVINKGEQYKFNDIYTLEDLKKLTAGQGEFWGDTAVLNHAKLPLTTSIQAKRLWPMLNSRRFDYLPLAVHEPWEVLKDLPQYNLTVEKNIMLVYPMALLFYVHKTNEALFKQVEQGMTVAIADGSYDKALKASAMIQAAALHANFSSRRIIYIDNPNISNTTIWSDYKLHTEELVDLISNN